MDARKTATTRWKSGESPVIAATTAYGYGINYAHVRAVIHCGSPYDLCGFIQESGRAGRDAAPATSVVVADLTGLHEWKPDPEVDDYIHTGNQCRRTILSHVADLCPVICRALPSGSALCDVCASACVAGPAEPVPAFLDLCPRPVDRSRDEGRNETSKLRLYDKLVQMESTECGYCLGRYLGYQDWKHPFDKCSEPQKAACTRHINMANNSACFLCMVPKPQCEAHAVPKCSRGTRVESLRRFAWGLIHGGDRLRALFPDEEAGMAHLHTEASLTAWVGQACVVYGTDACQAYRAFVRFHEGPCFG
jgi:hypothetical protein